MYDLPSTAQSVGFEQNLPELRVAAFQVINRLQSQSPQVQVNGAALALVAFSEALNLDPHDLVSRARRMMIDAEAYSEHIRAIREYAINELRRA